MSTAIPPRKSRVAEIRENRRKIEKANAKRKAYLIESEPKFIQLEQDARRASSTIFERIAAKF